MNLLSCIMIKIKKCVCAYDPVRPFAWHTGFFPGVTVSIQETYTCNIIDCIAELSFMGERLFTKPSMAIVSPALMF
jgi:hypothetical protein